MQRLRGAVLLHFLLLGGLLFAGQRGVQALNWFSGEVPIEISLGERAQLERSWLRESGQPPDAAQLRLSLRKLADDKMLLREAQRLGLNETDPVVRSRLLQNLRFAEPDRPADEASLMRQALALGMDERDLVTRRRLIQLMEQRLSVETAVSDAELRAHIAAHPERYASARRVSFRQVFLDADRHGSALGSAADALQARLLAGDAPVAGDPFLGGSEFTAASQAEITKLLGAETAAAVMQAPLQRWQGPIRSAYGLHFVYVDAVEPAQEAEFAALRQRAYYTVREQHEQASLRTALEALRQRYPLRIEPEPVRP